MLMEDDPRYAELIRAFENAVPSDSYLIFMGFRVDADFARRLQ